MSGKRPKSILAVALALLALALVPAAAGSNGNDHARPDDRAGTRGPGQGTTLATRPDDRAGVRGPGAGATSSLAERTATSALAGGFDWPSAGIGAAMGAGLILALAGAAVLVRSRRTRAGIVTGVMALVLAAGASGAFSDWGAAEKIDEVAGNSAELNTTFLDGCPIQSPDGLRLYMASNRPGGHGGLDIWVARRASTAAGFGAPVNLPAPINSEADDFCPTPVRGGGLFFVSRRVSERSCGLGDIYFSRRNSVLGWSNPAHLACAPDGPNSALDEQGPSYVEAGGARFLYFSRSSASVPGDIFVAQALDGVAFGPAQPVDELNEPANDIQPNVRKDGLELVFSSNRAGTLGGQDVWTSSRGGVDEPWSDPVNVGSGVNTDAAETRPSLSWDAQQLLFGRTPGPEGASDIYISTRARETSGG